YLSYTTGQMKSSIYQLSILFLRSSLFPYFFPIDIIMDNQTTVAKFILFGISSDLQLQVFLFFIFLVIYVIILLGNMLIMLVIKVDPHLQSPMRFFLSHLSFVDICYSSTIVPKMLENFLTEKKTISANGCITQMFFIIFRKVTIRLASVVWIAGNVVAFEQTVTIFMLSFHGSNKIEHFFCDVIPVLKLASTDTSMNDVINTVLTVVFIIFPFVLIITSYICILSTILKMRSAEGRHKAFSTCSSHLITITLFFGSCFITYMRPGSSGSVDTNQAISLLYTVITPMFNPIIYSLRNKEVKEALRKLLGSSRT
uniref:G-protein coupled receptors family 1 profile domain-containing protein n=1 Tax=Gopherus evgoodei TaxID=1825980 RepID=A0A8C4Y7A6_9SAUR